MSGEGRTTNEHTNLSSEVSRSAPTEQEATVPEPELVSELESEILAPLRERGAGEGIVLDKNNQKYLFKCALR